MKNRKMKGSSYLLEVLASNSFQGQHILISEEEQAEYMGLRYDSLRTVACFPHPVNRGFHTTRVPYTLGSIPGQDSIMQCYRDYPMFFQLSNKPIMGEIAIGPFRGQQVVLFNQSETRLYFGTDGIRNAGRQQKIWRGIAWRYAKTYAEAEPIYCHSNNKLLLSMFRHRFCYIDKPLSDIQRVAFSETLLRVEQQLQHWYHYLPEIRVVTPEGFQALAVIYMELTNGITHQSQFEKIRDTLHYFQDILIRGHRIRPLLLLGHCKILRRIATERI